MVPGATAGRNASSTLTPSSAALEILDVGFGGGLTDILDWSGTGGLSYPYSAS
jgi:hypothetical protein